MAQHFLFFLSAILAILTHGAGHMAAALLLGVRQMRLRRTPTGLRLVSAVPFPSYEAELFCALGGPLCNALGALLCRGLLAPGLPVALARLYIPLSLYLGLLNLLPLPGFDGDRILRCLLLSRHCLLPPVSPRAAARIMAAVEGTVLVVLWLLSVYLLLRRGSALSLYIFCAQLFFTLGSEGNKNGAF